MLIFLLKKKNFYNKNKHYLIENNAGEILCSEQYLKIGYKYFNLYFKISINLL